MRQSVTIFAFLYANIVTDSYTGNDITLVSNDIPINWISKYRGKHCHTNEVNQFYGKKLSSTQKRHKYECYY